MNQPGAIALFVILPILIIAVMIWVGDPILRRRNRGDVGRTTRAAQRRPVDSLEGNQS